MSQQLVINAPSYIEIVDGDSSVVSEISQSHADAETDYCPICAQTLPLSEFGVCRARPSGRNLYCKACIRNKVTESRRALNVYRERQQQKQVNCSEPRSTGPRYLKARHDANGVLLPEEIKLRCNEPHERVFAAIYPGARTQKQIRQMTGLSDDAVGQALAELLLSSPPKIETRILRDDTREVVRLYCAVAAVRKPNVTAQLPPLTTNILAPVVKGKAA